MEKEIRIIHNSKKNISEGIFNKLTVFLEKDLRNFINLDIYYDMIFLWYYLCTIIIFMYKNRHFSNFYLLHNTVVRQNEQDAQKIKIPLWRINQFIVKKIS